LLHGVVFRLERLRQSPKVTTGEGREQAPDGEQSNSPPFGHFEVDAALQSPREWRVRAQTLAQT